MKNLSITIIEKGNTEAPNVGTVTSLLHDDVELHKKAKEALESHFDTSVKRIHIQDSLRFVDVLNSPPLDAEVTLEDNTSYEIELQQTFLY